MNLPTESNHESERTTYERYGLRWSVLAAWHADLRKGVGHVDPGLAAMIVASRMKIATGSYSTCEIGCDLARVAADSLRGEIIAHADHIALKDIPRGRIPLRQHHLGKVNQLDTAIPIQDVIC